MSPHDQAAAFLRDRIAKAEAAADAYLRDAVTADHRDGVLGCVTLAAESRRRASADREALALLESLAPAVKLAAELRRCVDLLDGACVLPDGSNADTSQAHHLLRDFDGE